MARFFAAPPLRPALLFALLLLAGPNAAQAQGKVKVRTKPAKAASAGAAALSPEAPPPARPAPADADWSVPYAGLVTAARLRTHLAVLASDAMEGRETGTPGQHRAAAYVAEQFKNAGLTGAMPDAADPYRQPFGVEQVSWANGNFLQVGATRFPWLADFYGFGDSPFAEVTTVQPVFVGYGIEQPGYSDYAGLDVRGRDVLLLLGEPTFPDGRARLSADGAPTQWGADYRAKAELAGQKGARAVFLVSFNAASNFAKQAARLAPAVTQPTNGLVGEATGRGPAFFVSPAVGRAVLGTTEAALQAYLTKVNAAKKPVASPFAVRPFQIQAVRRRTVLATENVLGYVEGTDLKADVLVVSAHHDHLGMRNGQVFNGADDDGSGTAAVINLAEAFAKAKQEGHGPRRGLLFLSVTGEEKGLFGSEYYAKHPAFPLARTVADLIVDMIGRTDPAHEGKPDYVYVIGSDKLASELKVINEAQNARYTQLALDYRFDDPADPNRFYYRSDHYNFAVHRVPVAFFFSGVHADYHRPGDDLEKIQFDKMERRARLVFHLAWELANREGRLVVDSDKP